MNFDKVLELFRALEREGVEYVLVGGLATNLSDTAQAAQDVDIVLRLDETTIARVKNALKRVWDDPQVDRIQRSVPGRTSMIIYTPRGGASSVRLISEQAWDLSRRYLPRRGVFKFRSVDEASAQRVAWERARIVLIQQGMNQV